MAALIDAKTGLPYLTKQPSEDRLYEMDFSALLAAGETLSSVSSITQAARGNVQGAASLVIGSGAASGAKVQFRISGGTDGEDYKITVVATTSQGNTLEGEGWLYVRDL